MAVPIRNPSTLDAEAGELRVKNVTVKHLDILPTRLLACVMIFMLPNIVTWTLVFYGTLPQTTSSTAKLSRVGMKPRLAPLSQTSPLPVPANMTSPHEQTTLHHNCGLDGQYSHSFRCCLSCETNMTPWRLLSVPTSSL